MEKEFSTGHKRKREGQLKDIPEADRQIMKKYKRSDAISLKKVKRGSLKPEMKKLNKLAEETALESARAEMFLMPEETGYLETEGMDKTFRVKQSEILSAVDANTAKKVFDLTLDKFGPYTINFSKNGRTLLLAGRRGHVAVIRLSDMSLTRELFPAESCKDICSLHNESMFAVAQKKNIYIYDENGIELHCLRNHRNPESLVYLPYHFLLASGNNKGLISWQDVSTGNLVSQLRTKQGPIQRAAFTFDRTTGVVYSGFSDGSVSLVSPNMNKPLVRLFHVVNAVGVSPDGKEFVTTGLDGKVKIWDVRTWKMKHSYYSIMPVTSIGISQTGMMALGMHGVVEVWKDAMKMKAKASYMTHRLIGHALETVKFRPFEDILSIGYDEGVSAVIIPGSGEANIDTYEANPFLTRKQEREMDVHALLDKLSPDTIALNPSLIGMIDTDLDARKKEEMAEIDEKLAEKAKHKKEKHKMRGKGKLGNKLKTKQKNVITKEMMIQREKAKEAERAAKQSAGLDEELKRIDTDEWDPLHLLG